MILSIVSGAIRSGDISHEPDISLRLFHRLSARFPARILLAKASIACYTHYFWPPGNSPGRLKILKLEAAVRERGGGGNEAPFWPALRGPFSFGR